MGFALITLGLVNFVAMLIVSVELNSCGRPIDPEFYTIGFAVMSLVNGVVMISIAL